jgi:hypothetical protein
MTSGCLRAANVLLIRIARAFAIQIVEVGNQKKRIGRESGLLSRIALLAFNGSFIPFLPVQVSSGTGPAGVLVRAATGCRWSTTGRPD